MSKRTLGILVRQMRQSKGLTQYALAKDAGISTPYLQRLESGEYDLFPSDLLVGVARVLGVAPETLFNEMEKGAPPQVEATEVAEVPAPETAPQQIQELAQARRPASSDSGPQQGEPLMSLVPHIDPERLAQEIALLPDEDQDLVADFVQLLRKRRGQ